MESKIYAASLLCVWLLALAGCNSDGEPDKPEPRADHILMSCPIYYRWNGLWNSWTSCDNAWTIVENQPVFTSLDDCLIAKGHLQDEKSMYWDNSQEDKDRQWAHKLFCFDAEDVGI